MCKVLALITILGLRTKILGTYIAKICFERMKKNRKGNQPKKKEKKNLVRTGTVAISACEIGPRERLGKLYVVSCAGLRSVIHTEDDEDGSEVACPFPQKRLTHLPNLAMLNGEKAASEARIGCSHCDGMIVLKWSWVLSVVS